MTALLHAASTQSTHDDAVQTVRNEMQVLSTPQQRVSPVRAGLTASTRRAAAHRSRAARVQAMALRRHAPPPTLLARRMTVGQAPASGTAASQPSMEASQQAARHWAQQDDHTASLAQSSSQGGSAGSEQVPACFDFSTETCPFHKGPPSSSQGLCAAGRPDSRTSSEQQPGRLGRLRAGLSSAS